MDDKRTIMAMLLVGLIFLLMPVYYELVGVSSPRPEPEPRAEDRELQRDTTSAPPAVVPAAPAVSTPEVAAAPVEESTKAVQELPPERHVTIETPLQRLRFTTRGGVLVAARLEEYSHADGGPLELVPRGGYGLGLTIQPEAGEDVLIDLDGWHFEPDREGLHVEADGEGRLRLRAELGDGRGVEKVLVVRGDQYGVQVGVSVHGFSNDSIVRLSWHRGIALAEGEADLDLRSMKALAYINESLYEVQVDEDEEDSKSERGRVQWAGVRNKYFLCALAPETGVPPSRGPFGPAADPAPTQGLWV